MSLVLNEPLVLANAQTIDVTNVVMYKGPNGWEAQVTFTIYDDQKIALKNDVLSYTGASYDTLWKELNSGTFLYDQYIKEKSLPVSVPKTAQNDFTNVPTVDPVTGVPIVIQPEVDSDPVMTPPVIEPPIHPVDSGLSS